MMNGGEKNTSQAAHARPASTNEALLVRYLRLLRADPDILAAAAHPGRGHTLQWATNELRHTAATLGGLSPDEAEYELKRVLQEARERLGLWGWCD